jgi:hypothetical protein
VTPRLAKISPTPPSADLDADHDEYAPLRYRHLIDIFGARSPPKQATKVLQQELMLVRGEEPATFTQAEGDEAWEQTMREEMGSIEENNT